MVGITTEYKDEYKLQYAYEKKTITHEFPEDVTIEQIVDNVRDFLCGYRFRESTVNLMFKD